MDIGGLCCREVRLQVFPRQKHIQAQQKQYHLYSSCTYDRGTAAAAVLHRKENIMYTHTHTL